MPLEVKSGPEFLETRDREAGGVTRQTRQARISNQWVGLANSDTKIGMLAANRRFYIVNV